MNNVRNNIRYDRDGWEIWGDEDEPAPDVHNRWKLSEILNDIKNLLSTFRLQCASHLKPAVLRRLRSFSCLVWHRLAWLANSILKLWNWISVRLPKINISGRYEKDSLGEHMMNNWRAFFERYKSSAVQQRLQEVTDALGPETDTVPFREVVNKLFEDINSFITDVEYQEVRHGIKTFSQMPEFLMDTICVFPEEIDGLLQDYTPDSKHTWAPILAQATIFVDNLKKLAAARNSRNESDMNNLTTALLIQMMVFLVTNNKTTKMHKDIVTRYCLYPLSSLKINMPQNTSDKILLGLEAFLNSASATLNSINRPLLGKQQREVLAKYGVPPRCSNEQIVWVFLLEAIANSNIFSDRHDEDNVANMKHLALNIIQALNNGSIDQLAARCFKDYPQFIDLFT